MIANWIKPLEENELCLDDKADFERIIADTCKRHFRQEKNETANLWRGGFVLYGHIKLTKIIELNDFSLVEPQSARCRHNPLAAGDAFEEKGESIFSTVMELYEQYNPTNIYMKKITFKRDI